MAPQHSNENGRCYRQIVDLKAKYPGSKSKWKSSRVTWIGKLQPNPLCDTYTIQISWDGRSRRPVVRILHPRLTPPEGKHLPHVFADDQPCLHFPDEWDPEMLIADTIIPWTSEWLYFYELWLVTGDWQGGGHEPLRKVTEAAEPASRPLRHQQTRGR